ncbi:MAG: isoleucine--tRNA ligase [Candidatus Diapherotrites archaeon CG08_land_8_20_14_0_20_34_12]|nr:MAG: isoleucine--tRNA ligase [Candidatus Diapherotrites archaeon CG08_land_8_20_14_0_20_34_12]
MAETLQEYNLEKEKEILEFWKKNKIPEKVKELSSKNKKNYYFMDGPPYATGHIHMGTALNKILKDIAIRSKRMQGHNVFCRAGYDTHGLPIEHKVEKELGIKNKQEIEEFGVQKFVDACRKFATEHIDTMNAEFLNLGAWLDFSNPYLTLSNEYIEAIWWTFKKAEEKGLLFLGKYPIHACPRCATAVAYNEIEYVKQTDTAVYVKFPVKGKENTYLLIWTTTPWTLPANAGVMVHPKFEYADIKLSNSEHWIIAKEKVQELMKILEAGYTIEKIYLGKDLEGWKYENPLLKHMKMPKYENAYRVILSERYVNLEEGTGLVHTAPGHGKEDYDAGIKAKLPVICPVSLDGRLDETTGKYANGVARVIDKEIVKDLEDENLLIYKHHYTHDYPVCWRCKTPLLMISSEQWFFKIEDIRNKLIDENKTVIWVPAWMKDRMHNWLESLGNWPISRERYWGTPLPIWICENEKCKSRKVLGSVEELKKESGLKEIKDLHKPFIDSVLLKCKCGAKMKRISHVMDVWFDSGVSSWGALDYPKRKDLFEKFWPADLNIEGTDQVRGWWNSQIITSMICFDKKPFKAIAVHGMVLDVSKKKMSKSLGNIIQPSEVIEKYNRDYLRYYLIKYSKGEDLTFDWNIFKDIKRFFNILWNSINFASIYLDLEFTEKLPKKLRAEDRWILSRLNSLILEAERNYNNYSYYQIISEIEDFVLEDFSRTYIKLTRDRTNIDKENVSLMFNHIASSLLRLLAPIAPHITEYVYQGYGKKTKDHKESIHLYDLPKVDNSLIDEKLEKEMNFVKEISQAVLSMRNENNFRLRWALKSLAIESNDSLVPNLKDVLASMINVKKVYELKSEPKGNFVVKEMPEAKIYLDKDVDSALKDEWELRELIRKIQDKRADLNLNPNDEVKLMISCDDPKFLIKFKTGIENGTNSKIEIKQGQLEKLLERSFYFSIEK